jgi:hypothetical protein
VHQAQKLSRHDDGVRRGQRGSLNLREPNR